MALEVYVLTIKSYIQLGMVHVLIQGISVSTYIMYTCANSSQVLYMSPTGYGYLLEGVGLHRHNSVFVYMVRCSSVCTKYTQCGSHGKTLGEVRGLCLLEV